MRRIIAAAFVAATVAAVVAGFSLGSASATPPIGATTVVLAQGTNGAATAIPVNADADVVMAMNTFPPGSSSGWHSHPGGALVVVQSGQITLYRSRGSHCTSTTYTAGQSFFERPSDVQNGVNEGTTTTVVYVTFPGVPVGGSARIDRPDPGC